MGSLLVLYRIMPRSGTEGTGRLGGKMLGRSSKYGKGCGGHLFGARQPIGHVWHCKHHTAVKLRPRDEIERDILEVIYSSLMEQYTATEESVVSRDAVVTGQAFMATVGEGEVTMLGNGIG